MIQSIYELILLSPSPPATTDPSGVAGSAGIGPKEWITVGASLILGFGSALLTNWLATRRASADREERAKVRQETARNERHKALRTYERVLLDVAGDSEAAATGFGVTNTLMRPWTNYVEAARSEAYHYFHLFPEEDQHLLRSPHTDHTSGDDWSDVSDRYIKAAEAIQRFLTDDQPDRNDGESK